MRRHVYKAMALGLMGSMGVWGCNTALEAEEVGAVGAEQAAVTSVSSETLSSDLLGDTTRVFPDGRSPVTGDVDFIDNQDPNLLVQQNNSEVFVTFISVRAGYNNTLAYFTYPNGSPPGSAPALTVVFPSTYATSAGARVSLGRFNANTRIGFAIIQGGGTTNPPDLSKPKFYSVASLNGGNVHFASKYHKAEERRVIGAEDIALASSDRDYNDVLFSVRTTPPEQPLRVTICSYTFSDLATGWRYRTWQPSDCSAGLPLPGSIAIGNPESGNGDPRQQADCQLTQGGHFQLGSGPNASGQPVNTGVTTGKVTCAYLLPAERTDIRTCSYTWSTSASGWRSRTWQSSDCPQGLPESGSWAIGQGTNGNGTSGDVTCNLGSGEHYNHPLMTGATSGVAKCMYIRPTQNNDNLTVCRYVWPHTPENFVTGWRTRTWQASDCSNGLPKAGAWSVGHAQNGNGTRGMVSCSTTSGSHYNHPDITSATSGAVTCLYMNP